MTNPTCDPVPIARPSVETLYAALLCEVALMMKAQENCWSAPTKNNNAERKFREELVIALVWGELKFLNITTNKGTLFIPDEEIPY